MPTYGPNSEQVEAYLQPIAELDADDWSSLARALRESPRIPRIDSQSRSEQMRDSH